jgi:copper chaperone CopZ
VRVAVRKLEGVESVEVSLERASADIRLRPANRVTMAQLRQIIKNNGFSAKDATVTAVGTLVERGGKPALNVTGIDAVWLLTSPGAESNSAHLDAAQRIKSRQSGSIEVVGIIAAPTKPNQPEELAVQVLKPAPK